MQPLLCFAKFGARDKYYYRHKDGISIGLYNSRSGKETRVSEAKLPTTYISGFYATYNANHGVNLNILTVTDKGWFAVTPTFVSYAP